MDPNPTSHAPHLHDAKIGSRCQRPLVARDCALQLSPLLMDHPHVAVCLGIAGLKLHSPLVMLQGRVVLRGRGGGNDMAGGERETLALIKRVTLGGAQRGCGPNEWVCRRCSPPGTTKNPTHFPPNPHTCRISDVTTPRL